MLRIFPILNLRNGVLIEFLSGTFLIFLSTYKTVPQSSNSEKELLITSKKKHEDSCKANLIVSFWKKGDDS